MKTRPLLLLALGACLFAGRPWLVSSSRAAAAPSPAVTSPTTDKKDTIAYRIARDIISIVVALEPDVPPVFSNAETVNGSLRALAVIIRRQKAPAK